MLFSADNEVGLITDIEKYLNFSESDKFNKLFYFIFNEDYNETIIESKEKSITYVNIDSNINSDSNPNDINDRINSNKNIDNYENKKIFINILLLILTKKDKRIDSISLYKIIETCLLKLKIEL